MCVSVSSVGFVQYSQSGGGGSVHALLSGPGAPLDAALYTEDAPRRERERKKKKSVPSLCACVSVCVCGFEFFVHAYAGRGQEIVQAYNTVLLQYKRGEEL